MNGDCSFPGLGLTLTDRQTLISNVNIVFHAAATVRFDEKLKLAIGINVHGIRDVLDICKQMTRLKVSESFFWFKKWVWVSKRTKDFNRSLLHIGNCYFVRFFLRLSNWIFYTSNLLHSGYDTWFNNISDYSNWVFVSTGEKVIFNITNHFPFIWLTLTHFVPVAACDTRWRTAIRAPEYWFVLIKYYIRHDKCVLQSRDSNIKWPQQ